VAICPAAGPHSTSHKFGDKLADYACLVARWNSIGAKNGTLGAVFASIRWEQSIFPEGLSSIPRKAPVES
jgi:hypothetical protein